MFKGLLGGIKEFNNEWQEAFPSPEAREREERKQELAQLRAETRQANAQTQAYLERLLAKKGESEANAELRGHKLSEATAGREFDQSLKVLGTAKDSKKEIIGTESQARINEASSSQELLRRTLAQAHEYGLQNTEQFLGSRGGPSPAERHYGLLGRRQELLEKAYADASKPRGFGEALIDALPGVAGLIGLLVA
jgi:hypothetical protein